MPITTKPGIYLIRNKVNNKIYVGKSVNIRQRFGAYRSAVKKCRTDSQIITRAIKKYGWENFSIELLECFDAIDHDLLLQKESEWIAKLNTTDKKIGYNIRSYEEGTSRQRHSEDTKLKIKAALKLLGDRSGENSPNYGSKRNDENKINMSISALNRKQGSKKTYSRKALSSDHKMKIRETSCKYKVPVKQIDRKTNETIKVWNSAKDAAEFLTGKRSKANCISSVCNKYVTKNGYLVETALGFKWGFLDSIQENNGRIILDNGRKVMKRPVEQIDAISNQSIRIWDSPVLAAKELANKGQRASLITLTCNSYFKGVIKVALGYKWRWVDQKIEAIKDPVTPSAFAAQVPVIFP
jgi:group I intron endonuclease